VSSAVAGGASIGSEISGDASSTVIAGGTGETPTTATEGASTLAVVAAINWAEPAAEVITGGVESGDAFAAKEVIAGAPEAGAAPTMVESGAAATTSPTAQVKEAGVEEAAPTEVESSPRGAPFAAVSMALADADPNSSAKAAASLVRPDGVEGAESTVVKADATACTDVVGSTTSVIAGGGIEAGAALNKL